MRVLVPPGRSCAEAPSTHSRLVRDIFESAISQIAIKNISSVACHVKVHLPVIVVISDGNAHAPAFASEPSLSGDVFECSVSLMVPKRDHQVSALTEPIDGRTHRHYDIQTPAIVAIDEANSPAGGFH